MGKKVIVAGHICLDITPVFRDEKVSRIERFLTPGKLVNVSEADVHIGGAVANTGLAMKILGADVSLIGKVGNDAFGTMIQKELKEYDAGDGIIVKRGESTSYSVILAIPGIDRIFLHNPGTNDTFCEKDISFSCLKECALFHFGYPPLMKTMYANEGEGIKKLLEKVKMAGCAVSLDMASIDPEGDAGKENWYRILQKIMPYVDFFEPSAEELCYMLDREHFLAWQKKSNGRDITDVIDIKNDIVPLADVCMELGAKVLVIKCGAKGMYYRTASEQKLMEMPQSLNLDCKVWAEREGVEKSYIPEKVLSATGAGDTSIAAFLAAMLEGCTIKECMELAAGTGACCVASYDALGGLVSFSELRKKIRSGWEKQS